MQALAEGFLKKQLAKSPFTIKTILDLVSFLKLNGQSRDTATIMKTIQDIYASEFLKEYLDKLPAESKTRLDRFMANSLDDFVELAQDPTPVNFIGALFSCVPVLCGNRICASVAVAETTAKAVIGEEAFNAIEDAVKKEIKEKATEHLGEAAVKEIELELKEAVEESAATETSTTAPVTTEPPVTESSSQPETSGSESTSDVSGNSVETTPVQTQETISV